MVMIDPGRLNKRGKLQARDTGQDVFGQPPGTWSTYVECWMAVEPLRGRELIAAQQYGSEVTIKVTMRYRPGVLASHRILLGSRVLDIKAPPIDWREAHEFLELLCAEGLTDG